MGKIRVKTFGDEELEQKEAEEARLKKEAKIAAAKGMAKVVEEPKESSSAEALEGQGKTEEVETMEEAIEEATETEAITEAPREAKHKEEKDGKAFHSKKYQTLSDQYDKSKTYSLKEALETLIKLQRKCFDETVELHLNTT